MIVIVRSVRTVRNRYDHHTRHHTIRVVVAVIAVVLVLVLVVLVVFVVVIDFVVGIVVVVGGIVGIVVIVMVIVIGWSSPETQSSCALVMAPSLIAQQNQEEHCIAQPHGHTTPGSFKHGIWQKDQLKLRLGTCTGERHSV